ncbi:MAG: hypothetical protein ABIL25_10550, partial [candidate division WOR-3 bacterium]
FSFVSCSNVFTLPRNASQSLGGMPADFAAALRGSPCTWARAEFLDFASCLRILQTGYWGIV